MVGAIVRNPGIEFGHRDAMTPSRVTFVSTFGLTETMIGVVVGLGAVWRFPSKHLVRSTG